MNISIPALTYSGDSMAVNATGSELDNMSIAWLLSVDGGTAKPYTQYAADPLSADGGNLRIPTDKTIAVKLMAEVTDSNSRKFTFTSNTGTIKPMASFPFTVPSNVHIGSGFQHPSSATGLDGESLWSLTKISPAIPETYLTAEVIFLSMSQEVMS